MLDIVTAFPCRQEGKAVVGALWRDWSHLWQAELSQVSIQESYAGSEWRDDLKKVLRRAWQNAGTYVAFLSADSQTKVEPAITKMC